VGEGNNGLTAHQISELFGDLKEIKGEMRSMADRLQAIERNQARHQTTLETSVNRQKEDRARIQIAETNVVTMSERVSRLEERQKIGAVILGGFQVALSAVAAWIGTR
jgi:chromosome segregation ATPase